MNSNYVFKRKAITQARSRVPPSRSQESDKSTSFRRAKVDGVKYQTGRNSRYLKSLGDEDIE